MTVPVKAEKLDCINFELKTHYKIECDKHTWRPLEDRSYLRTQKQWRIEDFPDWGGGAIS